MCLCRFDFVLFLVFLGMAILLFFVSVSGIFGGLASEKESERTNERASESERERERERVGETR